MGVQWIQQYHEQNQNYTLYCSGKEQDNINLLDTDNEDIDNSNDYCFKLLGGICKERIAAIGDSFRTDLAGARNAGIDPILVCGGIHSAELSGFSSMSGAIEKLASEWGVMPVATMDIFTW